MEREKRKLQRVQKKACSWEKPEVRTLKLNVDGLFSEQGSYGGAGMILRDDTGAVLLSACRYIPF